MATRGPCDADRLAGSSLELAALAMAWPRRARSCLPAYVPPYPIAVACGRPATQLPAWRRLISSSPSSSPLRDKGQRFVLRRGGSSHAAAGQHRAAAARCSTTLCAAAGHRCAAGQRLACGRRAVSRVGGEMRARLCVGAAAASGVEGAAGAIWPPALCSGAGVEAASAVLGFACGPPAVTRRRLACCCYQQR